MPNKKQHRQVSSVVGGAAAALYCYSKERQVGHTLIWVLGGYLGGRLVGSLPDFLDRPTSPNHRGLGHAVVPNVILISASWSRARDLIKYLDEHAERFKDEDSLKGLLFEFGCYLACGMIVGVFVGHLAHLAADFCTPKGLPLISGKFE